MAYDPKIHHRRSIRLKGYNYAKQGSYFVTICTQNRECLFGEITKGEMHLNSQGNMINRWIAETENKFKDIKITSHIIMPNHIHAIITKTSNTASAGGEHVGSPQHDGNHAASDNNNKTDAPVGADLRVCPHRPNISTNKNAKHPDLTMRDGNHAAFDDVVTIARVGGEHVGSPLRNNNHVAANNVVTTAHFGGEYVGSSLRGVVQWFKTMTTNEYIRGVNNLGWKPFDRKLWQRNYYESIIRNEQSLNRIMKYITNNPEKWEEDKLYNYTA